MVLAEEGKPMRRAHDRSRGFTLIELLVVISIIGLLAAILVPAIVGAVNSAKHSRAMRQVSDLDGAIKRYLAEYGKMPAPAGDIGGPDKLYEGAEQAAIVEILMNNSENPKLNPRGIVFLDLDPNAFGVKTIEEMKGLLRSGAPYKDPWGRDYGILLDLNFDEKIDVGGVADGIRAKVGVYSLGPDKKNFTMENTPLNVVG